MQTFAFAKAPIVPPYCLWVSGLHLISGCRAGADLPRLYQTWRSAGNRPAMGEKAPGAWGAPGADPVLPRRPETVVAVPTGGGASARSAQIRSGTVVFRRTDLLILEDTPAARAGLTVDASRFEGTAKANKTAVENRPEAEPECTEPAAEKVMFFPKPEPWNVAARATKADGFKTLRPISFCRKAVTFNPTSKAVG